MAIFRKRMKTPTTATEVMETVYADQPDLVFNMVLVAPIIAKALRSSEPARTVADLLMSDENPVYDYLTLPGFNSLSRVIGGCLGIATELGITADQFDNYRNDPETNAGS